jgi:hypothetical protein
MKKPQPHSFEATYPAITRWVKEFGRVEIGPDELMENFVKAIDRGGMPWGGKGEYESIDEALRDMDDGIKAFLEAQGLDEQSSPRQRPTSRSHKKARKSPTKASQDRPRSEEEQKVVKKVEKLDRVVEELRRRAFLRHPAHDHQEPLRRPQGRRGVRIVPGTQDPESDAGEGSPESLPWTGQPGRPGIEALP